MNHHALATELTERLAEYLPANDPFLSFARRALARPAAGGFKRGEHNPANVLTADNVREMRRKREQGLTYGQLAERYGISAKQVWRICKREQWGWVE